MKSKPRVIAYRGFLQEIEREFPSRARALQWAQQCGLYIPGICGSSGPIAWLGSKMEWEARKSSSPSRAEAWRKATAAL